MLRAYAKIRGPPVTPFDPAEFFNPITFVANRPKVPVTKFGRNPNYPLAVETIVRKKERNLKKEISYAVPPRNLKRHCDTRHLGLHPKCKERKKERNTAIQDIWDCIPNVKKETLRYKTFGIASQM